MKKVEKLIKDATNLQNASLSIKISKTTKLLNELIEMTSFLDSINPTVILRMKYVKNDIKEIKKCKNCFSYIKSSNINSVFCSSESCSSSYYNKNKTQEQIDKKSKSISDSYNKKSEVDKNKIKENRKKSMIEKYGVSHNFLIPEVKEKVKENNILKYGNPIVTKNKFVIEKIKKTNNKKYGGNSPMCNDDIKKKAKETTFEKYGTYCVPFKTYKKYHMPSGKTIKCLGFENRAYDKLLTIMDESDFLPAGSELNKILKPIEYMDTNSQKKLYYPDIYVPKLNKIIEVKSKWTYEINRKINDIKAKSCLNLGYDFEFWIYEGKNEKNIEPKIIKI